MCVAYRFDFYHFCHICLFFFSLKHFDVTTATLNELLTVNQGLDFTDGQYIMYDHTLT